MNYSIRKVFWVHLRLSKDDILKLIDGHMIEKGIEDKDLNKDFALMINIKTDYESTQDMIKLREKLNEQHNTNS